MFFVGFVSRLNLVLIENIFFKFFVCNLMFLKKSMKIINLVREYNVLRIEAKHVYVKRDTIISSLFS